MSDKIRVNFFVNGQGVGKPTEISTEDYIHFMIGQRDGDNYAMASFISGKFMKKQPVSPESVSMSKAVGVPMWVFDIDRAVQNHEDTKLFEAIDGRKYGISDDDDDDDKDDDDDEEDEDEEDDDDERTAKQRTAKKRKKSKKDDSIKPTTILLFFVVWFAMLIICALFIDK